MAGLHAALPEFSLALVQRGDETEALAPILWTDAEDYWGMLLGRLEANCTSPAADLEELLAWRSRFSRLTGLSAVPTWDNFIVRLLRSSLGQLDKDMNDRETEALAGLLIKCGLTSPAAIAEAVQLVIGRALAPTELQDFARLSDAFRKGGPRWRLPYPCRLYSPAVLAAVAHQFGQPDLERALANQNEFETAVHGLHQLVAALTTAFGVKTLAGQLNDESYHASLRQADLGKAADLLPEWEAKFAAFMQGFPEMASHMDGSVLATIHRQITGLGALLRRLATGVDPRFRVIV
jgi:hypothetical protein